MYILGVFVEGSSPVERVMVSQIKTITEESQTKLFKSYKTHDEAEAAAWAVKPELDASGIEYGVEISLI